MKKLLVGFFIFCFLATGTQAHAGWVSDSVMREILKLRSSLGAYAAGYNESGSNSSAINTPSITVLSPNNGHEAVESGQKIEISWMSPNITSALNEIYISDGTHKGHTESVRMENNQGSVIYTLDSNLIPGSNYKAYVSMDPRSAISASDSSDNPFTIKASISESSISVLTPNGRDAYEVGQQINVTWNSNGIPESNKNIDIILHGYNSNGVIVWSKELSSFTYNDGQEKVLLPTNLGGVPYGKNFVISVGTDSTNNPSPIFDYSDSTFTIGKATDVINGGCSSGEIYSSTSGQKCPEYSTSKISVLSPSVGSTYSPGQTIIIKWTKELPGLSYLTFYKDDSAYVATARVVNSPDNSGFMAYNFPLDMLPGKYKINAFYEKTINGSTSSLKLFESNGYFNIASSSDIDTGCSNGEVYSSTSGQKCPGTESSSVTVLSPNGGETFIRGEKNKISWNGGKNKVQVGIAYPDFKIKNLGTDMGIQAWIELNGKPNSSIVWDGISLKDLNGEKSYFNPGEGSYKIILISEDKNGNYCTPSINDGGCNYDLSDNSFVIKSPLVENGCSNREVYSSTNGQLCLGFDRGCNGTNFSSTTGQRCPASTITNDEGCNGTRYSTITGQYCTNYNGSGSENNVKNQNNNPTAIRRTLKWGQIGDDVKTLQQFLGINADGVFGRGTLLKVKNWQAQNGLNADGSFGFLSRQKANLAQ